MDFFFITLGSAEDLIILSAIEAAKRGHKVHLAGLAPKITNTLDSPKPHAQAIAESEIIYLPLVQEQRSLKQLSRLLNHRKFVYRRLRKFLLNTKPHFCLFNSTDFQDALPFTEVIRDSKIRYGTIDHGVFAKAWPPDSAIERLISVYRNAEANFFVSHNSLALAETQFGIKLQSAQVVQNPFMVPFAQNNEWPPDNDALQLACVARLHPTTKGQDILLKILSQPTWRNRKIHVNFYGSGGNSESLRREAVRLGLTSVTFHGFCNNVPSIWKKNHALILPSREENFPLAMVEASLSGRPSLVTDVGGMAEFIKEGINGFIAPAPTVQMVDDAMERLWDSRSTLEKMGRRAQALALKEIPEFPEKTFVDQLERLVQSHESQKSG